MFKPTKEQWVIAAGWVVFMILFWLLGASPKLTKAEAFFGLVALTVVYAGVVFVVKKILPVGVKK